MEHHEIGQRLRGFLEKKKPSKTDENHMEYLIDRLFESQESIETLIQIVTPDDKQGPKKLKKVLCDTVVDRIEKRIRDTSEETEKATADKFVIMLSGIIKGQPINQPAKWRAIRQLGLINKRSAVELLKETLNLFKKSEIVEKYEAYAKPYMGPDSGLELLEFLQNRGLNTDWMQALVDSVRRWTEDKKALMESAQDRGSKPTSKPGREQLETSARPEDQVDLSRNIEPARKPSHPRKPTASEFLDFLESGITGLREIVAERNVLKRQLDNLQKGFDEQKDQISEHIREALALRNELKEMTECRDDLNAQHQDARAKIQDLERDLRSIKNRAEQDVNMAHKERQTEVKMFKYELWQVIKDCFIEVLDPDFDFNSLPREERRWTKRLTQIFEELDDLDVVPRVAERN